MTRAGGRHQSGRGVDEGEASARTCTAIVAKDEGPQHDRHVRLVNPRLRAVSVAERVCAGWSLDMLRSPWIPFERGLVVVVMAPRGR